MGAFFHFVTDSGILKKDQLKQDTDKLNAFYLNHGFINAQVGEPEITHDKKGIYVKIPIVEGKAIQSRQGRYYRRYLDGRPLRTPE